MPRFDGTGPLGQGSMTGRGLGKCNPANTDENVIYGVGRGGIPYGGGRGRAFGGGRGRGWYGAGSYAHPYAPPAGDYSFSGPLNAEQELSFLKNQSAAIEQEWLLPYDRQTGSRLVGLGELGLGFLNTSDPQPDLGAGFLGAAVVALRTVGVSNVTVTWTGGTVQPNSRVYGLRLQYRVGAEGAFQDVQDARGQPVEYLRSPVVGDSQVLGPVQLPAEISGRPLVQMRWKYFFVPTGASGTRAALRLDDIWITAEGRHSPLTLISWQRVAGNRVAARFQGLGGESVQLWTSEDLVQWTPLRLLTATGEGLIEFDEPLIPGQAQRYYRLERVR